MSNFVFTHNVGLDTFRWQIPSMSEFFAKENLPGNFLELFLFTRNDALATARVPHPEDSSKPHPEALVPENGKEFGVYTKDNGIQLIQVHWYLPERIYDRAGNMLLRVLEFLSSVKEENPELDISMNHHFIHKASLEETGLTRENLLRFAADDTRQALELINRYNSRNSPILTALRRENNPPLEPTPKFSGSMESDYGDLVPEDAELLPYGVEAMLDIAHAYATVGCMNEIVRREIEEYSYPLSGNMKAIVDQYGGIPDSCESFERYVSKLAQLRKIGWTHIANIRRVDEHTNLVPNAPDGIIDVKYVLNVLRDSTPKYGIIPVTVEVDFPYVLAEKEGKTPIRDAILYLYDVSNQ